ncbi:hypothetical protein BGX21_007802 [Mortierella sp. AD011]|nr:hypothetical protein BGX20_006672 [Mortierella sp. AD010]KAF9398440.1 hypothetical protein BGX21_007802 [Mortierella sp. AD011]
MTNLTLFCVVDGESSWRAFPVIVSPSDYIGSVKALIKEAKKPQFDHIPADELTLYKAEWLALDGLRDYRIFIRNMDEQERLHPMELVRDVFRNDISRQISVIISRPEAKF